MLLLSQRRGINKMKNSFIKGFILSGILFSTISFANSNFNAIKASFPILIDGQIWQNEKPAVVIDGNTYLPLKAIGNALSVNVDWNSKNNSVEINNPIKSQLFVYSWCTEVIEKIENYMELRSNINNNLGISNDKIIISLEKCIEELKIYKSNKELFFSHCKNLNLDNQTIEDSYEYLIILLGSFEDDIISVKNDGTSKINLQYYINSTSQLSIIRHYCTNNLY
jgi:hypothetical protein